MTRSYKMLVLRAMIEAGAFPGRIALTDLVERVARLARRNPQIKADLSVDPDDAPRLRAVLMQQPLKILAETDWFQLGPGTFETTFADGRDCGPDRPRLGTRGLAVAAILPGAGCSL